MNTTLEMTPKMKTTIKLILPHPSLGILKSRVPRIGIQDFSSVRNWKSERFSVPTLPLCIPFIKTQGKGKKPPYIPDPLSRAFVFNTQDLRHCTGGPLDQLELQTFSWLTWQTSEGCTGWRLLDQKETTRLAGSPNFLLAYLAVF